MSARLIVLIPATGTALRWRQLDTDGVVTGSGILVGDARLDLSADTRVTAIVPGSAVSLHWIEMPKASAAQAAAAARHLSADYIAAPLAGQHVAAAASADDSGMRLIGIVDRSHMDSWLALLTRHGLDAGDMVPAPLLLPLTEGGITILKAGDMLLVRGPRLALEAEPALAELVIAGRPSETVLRDLVDLAATTPADALPLNLRQGDYRQAQAFAVDRQSIRRFSLLAAACVAALLGAQVITLLRYHFAARALETEIGVERRRAAPDGDAAAGFTATSAALFAALEASGSLRLESLRYSRDGGFRATLVTPVGAALEPLRARLAASGLSLVEGASRAVEDGQRIDIEVSRP